MKSALKTLATVVGILLEIYTVSSIGFVRAEQSLVSKRTLFDVKLNDNSTDIRNISSNVGSTVDDNNQNNNEHTENKANELLNLNEQNSLIESNDSDLDNDYDGDKTASEVNDSDGYDLSSDDIPLNENVVTENAKKKQYETDDFRADTMAHEPLISQPIHSSIGPPVPNHVQIDTDESVHVHNEPLPEPHYEEPVPIHHVHVEEPVYVHHVEPPPPPPPEPVLIPIPIAAPAPPPPPPPPCTVHIPVTIHLKGKLAIKMKHCENCDFTKNIEAIGPLKIAPINGLKGKLTGATEAQAKTIIEPLNDVTGMKRNIPPLLDLRKALSYTDDIAFDDTSRISDKGEVTATKKDTTNESKRQHVVVTKQVNIPHLLLPTGAFKRGVVISLPKGKALLKCVVSKKDHTKSDDSTIAENSQSGISTSFHDNDKNDATLPADNNDVVTLSSPSKSNSLSSVPVSEDESDKPHSRGHHLHKQNPFAAQFLKMFDKNMLVSLYKMAVKDILGEIHYQKKTHKRSPNLTDKIKKLQTERSKLETQFPGITKSFIEAKIPTFPNTRIRRSINTKNFKSRNGNKVITLQPQNSHTSNGARRVKLVDTDRPVKAKQTSKVISKKPKSEASLIGDSVDAKAYSPESPSEDALSFYGDLDPTKLIDDADGTPNCIDPMCVKQKQFIQHAGHYFESLDDLALEPYKKFMNGKESKEMIEEDWPKVLKLPYDETINVSGMKREVLPNSKRQSIFDSMGNYEKNGDVTQPSTIVELFGKLPRVPLKITLNPKGPLAKLKKPIEIDLRPPGKGEASTRMVATSTDPSVAVHIANRIFKEAPLDPKQEEKLQQVYADIKRRSLSSEKHLYLHPEKVIQEKAGSRMKIIVSLPKELSKLVSNRYHSGSSHTAARSESNPPSMLELLQKPTYIVGQANEAKFVGKENFTENGLNPKLNEYAETLRKLQDQTKEAMEKFNQMKIKDPYADIGKKRTRNAKKKAVKVIANDPYADMGSTVNNIEKRTETAKVNTQPDNQPTGSATQRYNILAQDPYATLGTSIKRAELPAAKKYKTKHHHKKLMPSLSSVFEGNRKQDIPTGAAAISLIRHEPRDITKEVTMSPKVQGDLKEASKLEAPLEEEKQKAKDQDMLSSLPHFQEALAKISLDTKKKLFQLKPFKFLKTFDSQVAENTTAPLHDPYADIGAAANTKDKRLLESKFESKVRHSDVPSLTAIHYSSKRSEDYDPYADLGTSIGLTQNESRMKKKNDNSSHDDKTQTVRVSKEKQKDDKKEETKKENKETSASTRTQDEMAARFINMAATHIGSMNTVDPYADLGASANGDPLPYSSRKLSTNTNFVNSSKQTVPRNISVHEQLEKEEHFVGKEGKKTNQDGETSEMETGDLKLEKDTSAQQHELATIEKLEKDIASQKVKADSSEFPDRLLLQKNVGKEIQGPYADMGAPRTKKKVVENKPFARKLANNNRKEKDIGTKLSEGEIKTKIAVNQERDVDRVSTKNADKKHGSTMNCLSSNPEQVMKAMKGTAEKNVQDLPSKTDPYLSIGFSVGRKHKIALCGVPIINEDKVPTMEEGELHVSSTNSLENAKQLSKSKNASIVMSSSDPYAEMGSQVDTKKKTLENKPDPYADMGTISTKNKIAEADGAVTIETNTAVKHFIDNKNKPQKVAVDPYTDVGGVLP